MPPTFESVWAALQEMQKETREIQKEAREGYNEIREMQKETARQMKETDRKIGELGNRFGELAEHLVAPSIMEKFNKLGFHFDQTGNTVQITIPKGFKARDW